MPPKQLCGSSINIGVYVARVAQPTRPLELLVVSTGSNQGRRLSLKWFIYSHKQELLVFDHSFWTTCSPSVFTCQAHISPISLSLPLHQPFVNTGSVMLSHIS